MNTIPLVSAILVSMLLLAIFAPRRTEAKATTGEMLVRGIYRIARFWWAVAEASDQFVRQYHETKQRIQIARVEAE